MSRRASRRRRRSGKSPPIRGINVSQGRPRPAQAANNPSTWTEPDSDPWINAEGGDTDDNLRALTSVEQIGASICGFHGAGHNQTSDIASLSHNNYVPRFFAWHGAIDNQWWLREPRIACWNATTGLRERVFRPVLGTDAEWPGMRALTIVRDPAAPADVVAPADAVGGLDLTSGEGTLRVRLLAKDPYDRPLTLRLRADVFNDSVSTTVPVETIPESAHTHDIGPSGDFALDTEFTVELAFGAAFQSDDPTRANPAVGFVNSRIRVSGSITVADGSDPGFVHRDFCEIELVKEKLAPEIDLYLDLSSFGEDQVSAAMAGGEARFASALTGELTSIPFFAEARVPISAGMTTQTDTPDVLSFPPGPTEESVLFFGACLDINQSRAQLPAAHMPAHPDGPFTAGEVQSIRSLMMDAQQCIVVEIEYDGDPTEAGSTPASSDNLARRNLLILTTDDPGAPLTHTVQHSFEVDQGCCLHHDGRQSVPGVPIHQPHPATHGEAGTHLHAHHNGHRHDHDRHDHGAPFPDGERAQLRFITAEHRERLVHEEAVSLAMSTPHEGHHPSHHHHDVGAFLKEAAARVDRRFPLVFDGARWQGTGDAIDELLFRWNDLPAESRVELYLPGVADRRGPRALVQGARRDLARLPGLQRRQTGRPGERPDEWRNPGSGSYRAVRSGQQPLLDARRHGALEQYGAADELQPVAVCRIGPAGAYDARPHHVGRFGNEDDAVAHGHARDRVGLRPAGPSSGWRWQDLGRADRVCDLRKLQYYEHSGSDRHLRDVAMMLRISGDSVDSGSLLHWAEHLDLLEILKHARRFSPDCSRASGARRRAPGRPEAEGTYGSLDPPGPGTNPGLTRRKWRLNFLS